MEEASYYNGQPLNQWSSQTREGDEESFAANDAVLLKRPDLARPWGIGIKFSRSYIPQKLSRT